jgi:hypothetical protein
MTAAETIDAFKKTRWYKPTLERYNAHLKACDEMECPELKESFLVFVGEIENAPTDECRADMLAMESLPPYEWPTRYSAYVMPITSEMFTGTPPGSSKPRGPRKNNKKKRRTK